MQFFLIIVSVAQVLAKCPLFSVESNEYDACYLVSNTLAHWSAAESICKILGGHLPSIHSQAQNDYLVKLAEQSEVSEIWIGASKVGDSWQNTDGTPFNYTPFTGGVDPPSPYAHSVATLITDMAGSPVDGLWTVMNDARGVNNHIVCQLPRCGPDGSAPPSLLNQTDEASTGLFYGDQSNAFYYVAKGVADTIDNAEDRCTAVGGHLPTIANAFQNSQMGVIGTKYRMEIFGIGYRSNEYGTWSWMDGSNSSYTNWGNRQPQSSISRNVFFYPDSTYWYATYDNEPEMWACEFNELDRLKYC